MKHKFRLGVTVGEAAQWGYNAEFGVSSHGQQDRRQVQVPCLWLNKDQGGVDRYRIGHSSQDHGRSLAAIRLAIEQHIQDRPRFEPPGASLERRS